MSLYSIDSIDTVPVLMDAETYQGKNNEYSLIEVDKDIWPLPALYMYHCLNNNYDFVINGVHLFM